MDFTLKAEHRRILGHVKEAAEEYQRRTPMGFRERVRLLAETGVLGYMFPKAYGGSIDGEQVDPMAVSLVREALGQYAPDLDTPFTGQGLGGIPVLVSGTEAQRRRYLPALASGEMVGALALTEPEAGSDLGNIQATAQPDSDSYIINGQKRLITNAGIADMYVVCLRTDAESKTRGLSAFIVEAATPGLTISPREMIAPHPVGDMQFNDCRVPRENLLGDLGSGFKVAVGNLAVFRPTVGAFAVGMAQRGLDAAIARAKERVQFGRPLADNQGLQFKFADMATRLQAARLMVYQAAWKLQTTGAKEAVMESSMAKLFATESAFAIINDALQVFGGDGVTVGNELESLYREIRPLLIYEGANEVQRLIIGRQLLR